MDREGRDLSSLIGTEPVPVETRRPMWLIAGIAAVIVVALVKPWGNAPNQPVARVDPTTAPPAPTTEATASAAPSRSPRPTPIAFVARDSAPCFNLDKWRLVVIERTATTRTRTWYAVQPVDGAVPDSEAVPVRPAVSSNIVAIGFCAPEMDVGLGPRAGLMRPTGARIWRVSDDSSQDLGSLALVQEPRRGVAELYRPPDGARNWEPGRYVMNVRGPQGSDAWFGVKVAAPWSGDTSPQR